MFYFLTKAFYETFSEHHYGSGLNGVFMHLRHPIHIGQSMILKRISVIQNSKMGFLVYKLESTE